MSIHFHRVGLIGKHTNPEVQSTFGQLIPLLEKLGVHITLETGVAQLLPPAQRAKAHVVESAELGKYADLVIVVGGDGSILHAARNVVNDKIPVVGINRGRKGFLTDISPQALSNELTPILQGDYIEESRFLITLTIERQGNVVAQNLALNDIVLHSGDIARMLEFEVWIDGQFVYRQRSDGMIVATPTGSTAHALAGGGPILYPNLDAMVLVPMQPHTLSSRPIVIDSNAQITLVIPPENAQLPHISCDGQIYLKTQLNDKLCIQRAKESLRLLHPENYDYYNTLRTKLGWSR